MRYKLLALLALSAVFISTASATHLGGNATINATLAEPTNISNQSQVMLLLSLWDADNQHINPDNCETVRVEYNYNTTTANNQSMTYIDSSQNRYYANFPVDTRNTSIDFRARAGDSCDGHLFSETHGSLSINPRRNLSVQILNDTSGFLEGETYDIWANVSYDNSFQPDISTSWSLHNHTSQVSSGAMTASGDHYSASINLPNGAHGFHYLVVEAHNSSVDFENATGGEAKKLQIEPLLGSSLSLSDPDSKCNSGITLCQKGATLELTYTETKNHADNITAWVEGNSNNLTQLNFTRQTSTNWTSTFTLPVDLNTSNYSTQLNITAIGKNDNSASRSYRNISIDPFKIVEDTAFNKKQGETIDLIFGPVHRYTDTPLERDQIDMFYLELFWPNGTQILNATVGNGTSIPDANYDSDIQLFKYAYDIPDDAPLDKHSFNVKIWDIYGEQVQSGSFEFGVLNSTKSTSDKHLEIIDISSGISTSANATEAEKTFTSLGIKKGNILIKNNGSDSLSLNIRISDSLANLTTYTVSYSNTKYNATQLPINITAGSQASSKFEFHLQEYKTYTGNITFMADQNTSTAHNVTIDVNFTVERDCKLQNGSLCVLQEKIDKNYTASGQKTIKLTTANTGNSSTNISYTTEGTTLQQLFDTGGTVELGANKQTNIKFNLTALRSFNGTYTGNISLENSNNKTLRVPVTIRIAIPTGDFNAYINGSTDLGELAKGNTTTVTVVLNNTGEVELSSFTATVNRFNLQRSLLDSSGNSITLAPGETIETSLELPSSTTSSGDYSDTQVDISSSTGVTSSFNISLTVLKDLDGEISDLEASLSSLETRITGLQANLSESQYSSLNTKLQEIQTLLQEAKSAISQGDRTTAETKIQQAESLQSGLEAEINTASESVANTQAQQQTTDGDGINIWLILIPLLFLVIIGVVVYLSIVPEEEEEQAGMPEYGPPRR